GGKGSRNAIPPSSRTGSGLTVSIRLGGKSGVTGDRHAPFCGSPRVRFPRATRHLDEGLDFLGFSLRRYRNGKLLTKPSKTAISRIGSRLAVEMRRLRGSNARAVLATIVPITRGWATYYRGVVSQRVFNTMDEYLWKLTYKWATYSHENKPKSW